MDIKKLEGPATLSAIGLFAYYYHINLYEHVQVYLISTRSELNWIFDSFLFQIIFYGALALEPYVYIPQCKKMFTASVESLNEAISRATLYLNLGIGFVLLIASVYLTDANMILPGMLFIVIYTMSAIAFIYRVDVKYRSSI